MDGGTTLVGRAAELTALDAAVRSGQGGGTVLVELAGDPGMGKTRLLTALYERARDGGLHAVHAAGARMTTGVPYAALTPLLRTLRIGVDGNGGGTDLTRWELYRAVRAAFDRPTLVCLDDAHWADSASLDLLGRLLLDPPETGLVAAVAHRHRQDPPELAEALGRSAPTVERQLLSLRPLSVDDVGRLVGLPAGPRLTETHAASGGNPLYALALRTGVDGGEPAAGPAVAALRAEIGGLEADQTTVLGVAAVAGDGSPPSLVLACSLDEAGGGSSDRYEAALDRLQHRDLLRLDGDGRLWFRHPVLQSLAYRQLPGSVRRRLHRRLAAELGRRGSTAPVRALHVVRSAQPGDVPAARLLLDCAHQIGPRAPGVAVEYLTAARSLLGPAEPDLVATIEVETARQLIATGDLGGAAEILRAPAPGTEPARHALVRARLSRLLGRYAEAVATLRAELADATDPRQVVLLALEGAMCAAFGGSAAVTEFVALAQRAVGEVSDPAYRAAVQVARAFLTSMTGGPVPTDLAAAAEALDALSDGHLVQLLDPFGMLGWTELELERDAAALRHFDRAIAIADRAGHADLLPYLLVGRSYASSRLGAFDTALDAARDAVDAARRLGGASVVLAVAFQASARVHVSGPAEAATVVRDSGGRPLGTERDWFAEIAARVGARIAVAAGDTGVDAGTLLRACGGETMAWVEVCNRPYWCTVLSEMFLARGDRDRARHWVVEAARHAAPLGLRGADAHVATARARVLAEVDLNAALGAAEDAVAGFGALGWAPDELYARLLTATLSARAGRWSAVTDQLARAHRLATSMPAPWLRRLVAGTQRQLQSAAGRQPAPGARGELTRRERQIAELVAAGATNADIAAALHVTVKTVEAHLSRTYRKLGVRSRAMLVDALRSAPRT